MAGTLDIGVFAHNEAARIGALIADLGRQTLLSDPPDGLDPLVLILANGCTDDTPAVARAAVAALPAPVAARIEVREFRQGGKSRTGHHFIHRDARPEAAILGFMDADIRLPDPRTLARMAAELAARPELRAFTSRPVKDVVHDALPVGPVARVIAAGGDGLDDYRTAICGQLFMLRADMARRIGLPVGLPVEDGFIRAMTVTDLLSAPEDLSRIDGQDDIYHVYASIRTLGELVSHQTRIVVGGAVNSVLFAKIRREAPTEPEAHALLMQAAADDAWLGGVLRSDLPRAPHGYVPFHFLVKRLRRGTRRRGAKAYAILAAGFGLDLLVYLRASLRMLRGGAAGHW